MTAGARKAVERRGTVPREPAAVAEARREAGRVEAEEETPGRRRARLVALARRFEREESPEAALFLLDRLRPLCPLPQDEADLLLWRGQLLKRHGRVDEAIEDLERGIPLSRSTGEPADEDVRYRLRYEAANCLFRLGRLDEAAARCREAIRVEPRNHEGWKGMGAILRRQGKHADAAACFVASAALFPEDPEAAGGLEAVVRENPLLPLSFPALGRALEHVREGFRFPRTSGATH